MHDTYIGGHIFGGWKSLVKPVTWQNILSCSVLPPEIYVMYDDAYIGGRSENNTKCVVHDHLGWKNWTTLYILPHHWLYQLFSQLHSCGSYSFLPWSHSINIKNNHNHYYYFLWLEIFTTNSRCNSNTNLLTETYKPYTAVSAIQASYWTSQVAFQNFPGHSVVCFPWLSTILYGI